MIRVPHVLNNISSRRSVSVADRVRIHRRVVVATAAVALTIGALGAPAAAETPVPLADAGKIVSWGPPASASAQVVPTAYADTAFSAAAAGSGFTIALTAAGEVVGWGSHQFGAQKVPASLNGVTAKAVAAGSNNGGAVTANGKVVVWGIKFPEGGAHQVPANLTGVKNLAIGYQHGVALKDDGTVVAWGRNQMGETDVPAGLSGVTDIATGRNTTYALKSDGTVVAWGEDLGGSRTLPAELTVPGNVTAIAARNGGGLALLADGTTRSWGTDVPGVNAVPAALSGKTVVRIAARFETENLALTSDGELVRWGDPNRRMASVPTPSTLASAEIASISANDSHYIALVTDLMVAAAARVTGTAKVGQTLTGTPATFSGAPDGVTGQWLVNGAPVAGATGTTFALTATHLGKRISYRSTASKGATTKTSTSAQTATVASNKSTPVVALSAPASAYGRTVNATVTVSSGATGTVTLTLNGRSLGTKTLTAGRTAYALPRTTNPGRWTLRAVYNGNATLNATSRTVTWTVTKTRPGTVKTKITKKPSSKKKGKATVTIARPAGLAAPAGKVTITLKKGKKTLRVKGTVRNGKAVVTLPKTARGTWKITTTYNGDTRYLPAKAKTLKHKSK